MPVLCPEPTFFPENLWNSAISPEKENRSWWVLHTRPRQEKALARQLRSEQVPFFLPLIPHRFRSRNQTLTSYNPLFPGYLFLWGEKREQQAALSTRRVVRALTVPGQECLWQDLKQIQQMIASGEPIIPEERLLPGMAVEITTGPLAGLKGKILKTVSGRKFVVAVDFIQKGASILLDDFVLTRL